MTVALSEPRGYLNVTADSTRNSTGGACDTSGGSSTTLLPRGARVCGCCVGECALGSLVADAYRFLAGTDVGLVNCGGIRASLAAGALTQSDLVQTLPFLNELVEIQVSGATLKAALKISIATLGDESAAPTTQFLQVAGLSFSWHFRGKQPILDNVFLERDNADSEDGAALVPLNDTATLTLVTNSYLAGGASGMFDQHMAQARTGQLEPVALGTYLAKYSAEPPGLAPTQQRRITQLPSIVIVELGLLCAVAVAPLNGTSSAQQAQQRVRREECDHVHHAVALLNDKSDGFMDDVLTEAHLVLSESPVGCDEGGAPAGLTQLRASGARMAAVIGPACDHDVAAVASSAVRVTRLNETADESGDELFISPSSTASALGDEAAFPLLARLASPQARVVKGAHRLAQQLNWQSVAVLHDDSPWGEDAAATFVRMLTETGGTLLNAGATRVAISELHAGRVHAADLLVALQRAEARIVFVALSQARHARALFAASYETGRLHGKGHAWLTARLTADALRNDDGTTNASALRGAEGLLGLKEQADTEGGLYQQYLATWQAVASSEACITAHRHPGARCDADGDVAGELAGSSALHIDAVLTHARAIDVGALYRTAPRDAAALYERMRMLQPSAGVSGEVQLDPDSGDRLGQLDILNIQLQRTDRRLGAPDAFDQAGHRGLALVDSGVLYRAAFVKVGTFTGGVATLDSGVPVFSGGATEVPQDVVDNCNRSVVLAVGNGTGCSGQRAVPYSPRQRMVPYRTCEGDFMALHECDHIPLPWANAAAGRTGGGCVPSVVLCTAALLLCIAALASAAQRIDVAQLELLSLRRASSFFRLAGALLLCTSPLLLSGVATDTVCAARPAVFVAGVVALQCGLLLDVWGAAAERFTGRERTQLQLALAGWLLLLGVLGLLLISWQLTHPPAPLTVTGTATGVMPQHLLAIESVRCAEPSGGGGGWTLRTLLFTAALALLGTGIVARVMLGRDALGMRWAAWAAWARREVGEDMGAKSVGTNRAGADEARRCRATIACFVTQLVCTVAWLVLTDTEGTLADGDADGTYVGMSAMALLACGCVVAADSAELLQQRQLARLQLKLNGVAYRPKLPPQGDAAEGEAAPETFHLFLSHTWKPAQARLE